ncbi:1-phosphatidylinositol 3-phosphate 5-kinase [Chionoecetes opilio]|uniref:1-phosphatidylinositol 3-phosphate 5-kinase n=1 Tax=Chionoecetes opilio TaxID=41210 RepID=A0A8J4Z4X1_CHIOP|nr:1-phosphatidylinositol 3-phosphate 5-kinase [Chionoecetes opilio]
MSRPIDSPTGLTEFGPLTPDEKPQGYGFSLSKLFQRAVRGASGTSPKHSSLSEQQNQTHPDQSRNRSGSDPLSLQSSDIHSDGGPSWLEKDVSEASGLETTSASSQDSLIGSKSGAANSSHHDRTLPNVLTRIRNILDNRGSTPQQYKDSDFKQYWLPDSVSRECYECEEKFTTFRRRHHCRVCGQIFCSRCCNSMIPGKIIGYTGELRVCTYCCKVVLSYLQSSNLAADVVADLRSLQEELLPPSLAQVSGAGSHDSALYCSSGSNTPLTTPRGTHRRRHSLGFQEEKYVGRTRYASGELQALGVHRDSGQMTAERQLLLQDSHQLHSLWSQMTAATAGLTLGSHRHRLKSFNNCFVGRDLVRWLLINDKASSQASAVAIGQALLEAGYILCISQLEQVFVDDYVLYRPLRQGSGDQERVVQEDLVCSQEVGQEPLWVKQITEDAGSPVESVGGQSVYQEPGHSVDTPSSITSSTSNYCLDFNLQDHVVSIRKPQHISSRHSSMGSDKVESKAAPELDSTPYSTTVSAALSASAQLTQQGDAVGAPAAVMAEVLQALRGHDVAQLQSGSGNQEKNNVTQDMEGALIKQRLSSLWASHETALLCQLLDSGGLSPSWADVILPIVHTVTDIIRPDVRNDSDDMDIRQYVQFKKVPGGSRGDCQIVNGAVCTKNVADKSMAVRLTDPQILLVASTIDYQRGNDNKLLAFDNLLLQSFDLEDQVFEEGESAPGKAYNLEEESSITKNATKVSLNIEDSTADINDTWSYPQLMQISKEESMEKDMESPSYGVPVPTVCALERTKLPQTVSDFSDPLHFYLNSGVSPQESPLEVTQGSVALMEQPLANSFRKAVDETILSCSPYLRYSVPYLESEAGRKCFLRKYFQKNLYFSVQFEKDNLMRRPKFSEMESKNSKSCDKKVEIQDLHCLIEIKLTNGINDKDFQAVLADFRARGGQMRNVCKCEDPASDTHNECLYIPVEKCSNGVVTVEGLPAMIAGHKAEGGNDHANKISSNTLWSGQSALMLTTNGRVDALHPFNHQRLSLLFSSYSQSSESGSPPAFCVNPWVLTMDFYGRNDIPLGAFLERYCFCPTYTCPSGQCSVAVLDHIRKFVHDTGCVDVVLRRLDTDLDVANTGAILVWSWCKICRQVTPVQPMSLETWSLSFAKYLELRFYGGSFTRRGNPGCSHSLHHDHYQYFGYKNHVAVFK